MKKSLIGLVTFFAIGLVVHFFPARSVAIECTGGARCYEYVTVGGDSYCSSTRTVSVGCRVYTDIACIPASCSGGCSLVPDSSTCRVVGSTPTNTPVPSATRVPNPSPTSGGGNPPSPTPTPPNTQPPTQPPGPRPTNTPVPTATPIPVYPPTVVSAIIGPGRLAITQVGLYELQIHDIEMDISRVNYYLTEKKTAGDYCTNTNWRLLEPSDISVMRDATTNITTWKVGLEIRSDLNLTPGTYILAANIFDQHNNKCTGNPSGTCGSNFTLCSNPNTFANKEVVIQEAPPSVVSALSGPASINYGKEATFSATIRHTASSIRDIQLWITNKKSGTNPDYCTNTQWKLLSGVSDSINRQNAPPTTIWSRTVKIGRTDFNPGEYMIAANIYDINNNACTGNPSGTCGTLFALCSSPNTYANKVVTIVAITNTPTLTPTPVVDAASCQTKCARQSLPGGFCASQSTGWCREGTALSPEVSAGSCTAPEFCCCTNTSTPTTTPIEDSCTDSDGGIDPFRKGTIVMRRGGGTVTYDDICYNDTSQLFEYYCDANKEIRTKTINCNVDYPTSICQNGACIYINGRPTNTPTVTGTACKIIGSTRITTATRTIQDQTYDQVYLEWTPASNAERYELQRSYDGGINWRNVGNTSGATSITIRNMPKNETLTFKVRGLQVCGAGAVYGTYSAPSDLLPPLTVVTNTPTRTPSPSRTPSPTSGGGNLTNTPTRTPSPTSGGSNPTSTPGGGNPTSTPGGGATSTPGPTSTPGGVATCPNKNVGDADCKSIVAGVPTNLADYEIWRREFLGGCSSAKHTAAACGADDDLFTGAAYNLMDANFNFTGSGKTPEDEAVTLADFEIWRAGYFTYNN